MDSRHPIADDSTASFTRHAPSGAIVHASPEACALLGKPLEALIGLSYFDLVHPDDVAELRTRWYAAVRGPEASVATYRVGISPPHRWIETTLYALRDDATAEASGLACVSRDVTGRREVEASHRQLLGRLQSLTERMEGIIRSVPGVIWEASGRWMPGALRMIFVSDHVREMTGYTAEEVIASRDGWLGLIHPEDRDRIALEMKAIEAAESGRATWRWVRRDGQARWVESHVRPVRQTSGEVVVMRGVTLDVTARAEAAQQERIIRDQAARLMEMSTPLIPIHDDVMVMPLIGALDAERMQRALETLLAGMSRSKARVAILDVTGVPMIDTHVADALSRAARAVRLLGAEVVVTGLGAIVARALVELSVDLGGIVTCRSLQDGIARALRRRRSLAAL